MDTEWIIELDRHDYQKRVHLMTIANGYMGVKGYFPELFGKNDSSVLAIGIYDQVGEQWKEIINNPNFWDCVFEIDSEKVELRDDNTESFRVFLDMSCSKLTMQYVWKSRTGKLIEVVHERIVCYDRRNKAAWKMKIKNLSGNADILVKVGLDADVVDTFGPHLENISCGEDDLGLYLNAYTQQHKYNIAVSGSVFAAIDNKAIIPGNIEKSEKYITRPYRFELDEGKTVVFENMANLFTSRDSQIPLEDAVNALKLEYSFDKLFDSHAAAIKKQWEITDVIIKGDEKAQKYMRFNLHILIISVPKDYDYCFTPSRMLSAQTYKGSIFWEVDTYAFPYLCHVFPQYAKNHLNYRYKTLAHALKKARDLGFEGAYYAWESLDTGEEATKKFVQMDVHSGKILRNYFGDRQYHISADVVYAIWQYYKVTGDFDYIKDYGLEITLQVARFFASVVYYKKHRDRYEILHTTCPDEYHEEVTNNHFTNKMAKYCLEKALDCIEKYSTEQFDILEKVKRKLDLKNDEIEYWKDVNKKIFVNKEDKNLVIEQFDGYFELEDITIEEFKNTRVKIKEEYNGYPVGPATYTQIIKQADVVQALVMFKNDYHPVVRKATFDYYDLRTEHGSGDSPNAYGVAAAQVGDSRSAYKYFMKSAAIDLESTNPVKKAGLFLGGLHTAPCGGTWQVLAMGFLGLEIENNILKFNPILPSHWQELQFNIFFKGEKLTIRINQEILSISRSDEYKQEIKVKVNDQPAAILDYGAKFERSYRKNGYHYYVYEAMK